MAATLSPLQTPASYDKQLAERLQSLANTLPKEDRSKFLDDMEGFKHLVHRYIHMTTQSSNMTPNSPSASPSASPAGCVDWSQVKPLGSDRLVRYESLSKVNADCMDPAKIRSLLQKLVVVKLNGGLGTTMGCVGPKSVIEVRENHTFLDLIVAQVEDLNRRFGCAVPLVLMNSFNTEEDTQRVLARYKDSKCRVLTFNQHRYPRIRKDDTLPLPTSLKDGEYDSGEWFPPGHGDFYDSFVQSDAYKTLRSEGRDLAFLSNSDNLGATVDLNILNFFVDGGFEFCSEVTPKTRADVKGGTLIEYDGAVRLLELAQVPKANVEEFKSIKTFKIFNTNNMWISLPALERVLPSLDLEIIVNPKMHGSIPVLQLETAAGAAIRFFERAVGLSVPRSRFLPVKSCSDLLIVQSNIYEEANGTLVTSALRNAKMGDNAPLPAVKLGPEFQKVTEFQRRFPSIPDLSELEHLTVVGDVCFQNNISLRGTIIIVANPGEHIEIAEGTVLENKIISDGMRMLDY